MSTVIGEKFEPETARLAADIGAQLRRCRVERDMTQYEAALRVGMEPKYWSMVECGKARPTLRTVARMFHALGYRMALSPVDAA